MKNEIIILFFINLQINSRRISQFH